MEVTVLSEQRELALRQGTVRTCASEDHCGSPHAERERGGDSKKQGGGLGRRGHHTFRPVCGCSSHRDINSLESQLKTVSKATEQPDTLTLHHGASLNCVLFFF